MHARTRRALSRHADIRNINIISGWRITIYARVFCVLHCTPLFLRVRVFFLSVCTQTRFARIYFVHIVHDRANYEDVFTHVIIETRFNDE